MHVLCMHTAIPVTPAGEEQIKNGNASFPDHSHLMVKHRSYQLHGTLCNDHVIEHCPRQLDPNCNSANDTIHVIT